MITSRVMAFIMAGGMGDRLSVLSEQRAKPAVPFGGSFRIIDFALSNCANSGITRVGVLTQYLPRSLNEHIGAGGPWGLVAAGTWLAGIALPFLASLNRSPAAVLAVLLHPVSSLLLLVAVWHSAVSTLRRGGVSWRGDVIALADLRAALKPLRWWWSRPLAGPIDERSQG